MRILLVFWLIACRKEILLYIVQLVIMQFLSSTSWSPLSAATTKNTTCFCVSSQDQLLDNCQFRPVHLEFLGWGLLKCKLFFDNFFKSVANFLFEKKNCGNFILENGGACIGSEGQTHLNPVRRYHVRYHVAKFYNVCALQLSRLCKTS